MKKQTFYQNHLNKVSRSFAFCVAELREPLREWVGLAYILCRVADTIEDAQWTDRAAQLQSLRDFKRFSLEDYSAAELAAWRAAIPDSIPDHEKELLADTDTFLKDLKALPSEAHRALSMTLINMIEGMAHFCAMAPAREHLRLASNTVANQYCFFVAGIVGELLTSLVKAETPEFDVTAAVWLDAIHFGLFLQKINMLKDQQGDEAEGRHLIHSRSDFRSSLIENAHGAIRYLTSIPVARQDYRIFCGWSLFLGLGSLPWIEKSWQEKSSVKISRTETGLLLARVRMKIGNNDSLRALFDELLGEKQTSSETALKSAASLEGLEVHAIPAWLEQAYHGCITPADFNKLHML